VLLASTALEATRGVSALQSIDVWIRVRRARLSPLDRVRLGDLGGQGSLAGEDAGANGNPRSVSPQAEIRFVTSSLDAKI
jgi:hypothetical protein